MIVVHSFLAPTRITTARGARIRCRPLHAPRTPRFAGMSLRHEVQALQVITHFMAAQQGHAHGA